MKRGFLFGAFACAVFLLGAAGSARAGSAAATMTCTADTGETLSGTTLGGDFEIDLTYDDGKGTTHTWNDAEQVAFHHNFKQKVYLLATTGTVKLKLYAIPRTLKFTSGSGREEASFKIKASITDLPDETSPRQTSMRCKYVWAI